MPYVFLANSLHACDECRCPIRESDAMIVIVRAGCRELHFHEDCHNGE